MPLKIKVYTRSYKVRQKFFIVNEKIPQIDDSNPITMKERNLKIIDILECQENVRKVS